MAETTAEETTAEETTAEETIVEVLRDEHDKAYSLMEILDKSHGNSSARREIFPKLRAELLAHAVAEQDTVYAKLLESDDHSYGAKQALTEHEQVKGLLTQLQYIGYDDPRWLRALYELRHAVTSHVEYEERELLPMLERLLTHQVRVGMAHDFRQAKEAQLEELGSSEHGRGVPSPETGTDARTLAYRSKAELYEIARRRNIPGRSKLSKAGLIRELRGTG
jgi:hemerythrin superfamily protein